MSNTDFCWQEPIQTCCFTCSLYLCLKQTAVGYPLCRYGVHRYLQTWQWLYDNFRWTFTYNNLYAQSPSKATQNTWAHHSSLQAATFYVQWVKQPNKLQVIDYSDNNQNSPGKCQQMEKLKKSENYWGRWRESCFTPPPLIPLSYSLSTLYLVSFSFACNF